MSTTPRRQFLDGLRDPHPTVPVVSPFLPHYDVVAGALQALGLPASGDPVADEITLSRELGYQPMFMTECAGLIFDWRTDESRSTPDTAFQVIPTASGEWTRSTPREEIPWSDVTPCPVQNARDHGMFVRVCEQVGTKTDRIRAYFREWRAKVGENGVIVLGHPHPSWLGYQINPSNIFFHWTDLHDEYVRSMEALSEAAMEVMRIALEEGIDFMSDSSYGLEMTSPALFATMDLPYIQRFAAWTHERGGRFWYHNCGFTRSMILKGTFNTLGADLIETIAPPPEGDNDLAESRRALARTVCSKGNLSLRTLRDGTPDDVVAATRGIVSAVSGYPHVFSTADAVLPGTPPENFVAFVRTVQETVGR
jgi:hypothetical protein